MKKILACFVILWSVNFLFAQELPPFLPEDVETKSLALNEFSTLGIQNKSQGRGIELSWLQIAGSELVAEGDNPAPDAEIDQISRFLFKGKAPIILKERLRILLGYNFLSEKYTFGKLGDEYNAVFRHLDGKNLKSQQFSLYVSKTISNRSYLNFRFRTAYNGDYGKFLTLDNKYQVFSATILYGMKRNENMEWGVGLNISNSFRRTIVLPVFMYNYNFSDKFGIEMILPALIQGRWNVKKGTMLFAGAQYSSRSYAIDVSESASYGINHSEIQFPIRLEQKIYSWFWLGAQAGYQYNFSTDFDSDNAMPFAVEPKSSPYFKIAVFFSPSLDDK